MRVGIAQMGSRAGDLDKTVDRMLDYATKACERGAELVVFPMAALTGPVPMEFADQEGFLLDLSEAVSRIADGAPCPCIVPVVSEIDGSPAFEALLIRDGDMTPLRTAAYLEHGGQDPTADEPGDSDVPAPDLPEFEVAGVRLGLAFTYEDLDDYDDFDFDLDAIIFVSGYGYAADDPASAMGAALQEARFRTDAQTCSAWMIGVGSVGGYGTQVFPGSSFVLAPWGELAAQAPSFEEALIVCDVETGSEGPLAHPLVQEVYDRSLTLWSALTLGLSDYVEMSGQTGAALLLDGSLASMTLATLASDALGPSNVHVLVVPLSDDLAPACSELVRSLRIDAVPIARGSAPTGDAALARDIAEAHLAALARSTGSLVLSSADKTTTALVERPTRVLAAALAPLGDVYLSDVIELARLRNTISPVIPAEARGAFEVPPVKGIAGVSPSRTQQVEFIDYALASHIEWERPISDVVEAQDHGDVTLDVLARYADNELSRRLAPPALLVSSRSLLDARKPLGCVWRDRVREKGERVDDAALGELSQAISKAVQKSDDLVLPGSKEMRDTLEFLRDFIQGGGMRPQGFGDDADMPGPDEMPPGMWGSPFSEN